MLAKLDGLCEYDVRRPLTASGTNLLGLVKHLATWEARYLGEVFGRSFPEPLPQWDIEAERLSDMWATEHESRRDVVDRYRRVWNHSDATVDALALDATGRVAWWQDAQVPLFDILLARRRVSSTRVLVIGASGGVGAYAVQLAALSGAEVTGLAPGSKLDRVRSWGATTTLDRHHTSLADLAHQGERFDVVLDADGGASYTDLRHRLRHGGTVVSTRPISSDTWRAAAAALPGGHRVAAGYGFVATKPRSPDLARLLDLLDRGLLTAPVDTVVAVAQVRRAHRLAETTAAGKVVLQL